MTLRQAREEMEQGERLGQRKASDGVSNARLAHGHDTEVTELTEEEEEEEERKRLEEQVARRKWLESEALQLEAPVLRTLAARAEQGSVPPFATMMPAAPPLRPPLEPRLPVQAPASSANGSSALPPEDPLPFAPARGNSSAGSSPRFGVV